MNNETMTKIAKLAAAALLTISCSGTEPGPLRVSMSLDKSAVAMDEPIALTMTVVNISTRPVMVFPGTAYGPCLLPGFELFDREWRVGWEGHYCLLSSSVVFMPEPVPLGPGERIEITRTWRASDIYFDGERLTPGLYRLRGVVRTPGGTIHTGVREIIVGN